MKQEEKDDLKEKGQNTDLKEQSYISDNSLFDYVYKWKLLKIHKTMAFMEQSKYLDPHLSFGFEKLVRKLKT